jgi:hypothetical protein
VILLAAGSTTSARAAAEDSTWHLQTDDTTLTLEARQGKVVLTQLGSAGHNENWLVAPVFEILLKSVTQQGAETPTDWQYERATQDEASGELVLRYSNGSPAMELRSIWRARPGHGPIEHWLTITNRSQATITIGHQDSLLLSHIALPAHDSMDAWWIRRGASNATNEGGTFVRSVGRNSDENLVSDPTDGASPVPWLSLQVGTSRGLYVGWEFSGVGRVRFHSLSSAEGTSADEPGQIGIEVGNNPAFKTDLPAGETFLVPPAFVGCYLGDVDDGSYTLHRFILEKLVPPFPAGYAHPTLAYNLYLDSGGADATEQGVLQSIETAKSLGFETFVVDAMWFPQSGDWRWDPKRFPHGHEPIEEAIHRQNMKFGLWVAYTQGSDHTDPAALNVTSHADWFTAPSRLDPEGHINWGAQIDLGSDAARDWVEQSTQRIVSEYKVDYFKTDYSPIATSCQQTNHRHHYGVDVSYWSTLGYYAVQEALLRKFPDLILEGCSGSGHIKDFGDIQRVHLIAINDTLSSLPNRQAIYDSSFAFPPSVLMDYTYENFYDTVSDAPEPYLWRSSMMNAWQIDPTHSASWTPEQRAKVRRQVEIYKSWIRPILADVQVHHILPRPDGYHWDGMFYWNPSLKRGTLYIFRPNSDTAQQQVPLKGLAANAKYTLRSEDHSTQDRTYSGVELMKTGLPIQLRARYTSDLIYLEEVH